jgi:hypothetical protein
LQARETESSPRQQKNVNKASYFFRNFVKKVSFEQKIYDYEWYSLRNRASNFDFEKKRKATNKNFAACTQGRRKV